MPLMLLRMYCSRRVCRTGPRGTQGHVASQIATIFAIVCLRVFPLCAAEGTAARPAIEADEIHFFLPFSSFLSTFSSLPLECVLFALPLGPRLNFIFLLFFPDSFRKKVGEQYTLAFELETAKMGFSTRMKISARTFFQPFIDPKNTSRQGKEGQIPKDPN